MCYCPRSRQAAGAEGPPPLAPDQVSAGLSWPEVGHHLGVLVVGVRRHEGSISAPSGRLPSRGTDPATRSASRGRISTISRRPLKRAVPLNNHVDLLLLGVAVAEWKAEVRRHLVMAEPRLLEAERRAGEAGLDVGSETVLGSEVLDVVLEVQVRVVRHGRDCCGSGPGGLAKMRHRMATTRRPCPRRADPVRPGRASATLHEPAPELGRGVDRIGRAFEPIGPRQRAGGAAHTCVTSRSRPREAASSGSPPGAFGELRGGRGPRTPAYGGSGSLCLRARSVELTDDVRSLTIAGPAGGTD